MGETTKIQWTDYTFNPWIGCTKVHTGCANCYAEADMDKRRGRARWGPNGSRSKTSADYWRKPLKWNRSATTTCLHCGNESTTEPAPSGCEPISHPWDHECWNCGGSGYVARRPRVFCASLADVFEDWEGPIVDHKGRYLFLPNNAMQSATGLVRMDDLRRDLFSLIDATPHLDWLILTKRPENIRRMWPDVPQQARTSASPVYRDNVWLGTSVSDQQTADKAVPELLACRDLSPVLFLSVEPLLGPVCLEPYLACPVDSPKAIRWVIVGGESGPGARPANLQWTRDIIAQCRDAGVPVFHKQLGPSVYVDGPGGSRKRWFLEDSKGGDPAEWPDDLRVREFPKA